MSSDVPFQSRTLCALQNDRRISQSLVPLIIEASKLAVHAIHCADANHLALLVCMVKEKGEDRTLSAKPALHPVKTNIHMQLFCAIVDF